MHVYELKIISDQVFLFLCLFFCFVFNENADGVSFTPSSIHLLALLHFSLSAVWVL